MRKPRLTEKVLSGLNDALSRMEADDLTDQSDEESAELHAAQKWLTEMYQWRDDQKRKKDTDAIFKNGGVRPAGM